MSEQNKSNLQALGAGLLGFVAVMAVGGGALMIHSSMRAKSASAPVPAAAPIDLGASMPAPPMPAGVQKERRQESPAPLIEAEEQPQASEHAAPAAAPAPAAASSPESAPAAKASALEVTRHLDAKGASTAEAAVKNTLADKKAAKAPKLASKLPARSAPAPKLELPAGDGAVASVHYGVTSRSELMGRAAGPVYNMKGSKGGEASTAASGKLAADADGKIADLRRQLEASGLPPEQRAKLLKDLDDSMKRVEDTGRTAQ